MVNVTTTTGDNKPSGKGRGSVLNKICTHYEKSGYTVEVYYKKHGFAPNFKLRNSNVAMHNVTTKDVELKDDDASSFT